MAYAIEVHPEAQAAIEALPAQGLHALVEVFALLELSPWTGPSVNPRANPDAPLRDMPFGALRATLAPYVAAGQPQKTARKSAHRAIREWARRQGLQIAARGRIPDEVVIRYEHLAGRR